MTNVYIKTAWKVLSCSSFLSECIGLLKMIALTFWGEVKAVEINAIARFSPQSGNYST